MRGLNWNAKCIVADEAQNMTLENLEKAIKYFKWDHPSYDKSRIISIYNQLNDADKKQADIQFMEVLPKILQ